MLLKRKKFTSIKTNTPISKTWPCHLYLKDSQDPKEKKGTTTSTMCKTRKMNSELNLGRKSLRKDSTLKGKNLLRNNKSKKNLNFRLKRSWRLRLRKLFRFKNLKNKLRILLWRTKASRRRMLMRNSNYKMNVDLVKGAGIDSLAGIFILKMRKIIGGEIQEKGKHQR